MIHRDDRPIDVRTPACDRFDELLPDWLEGTLATPLRLEADRHRAECARCAALASGLQGIAHAARALPPLRPERDLWAGIAERIEPAVVPLDVRRVAADVPPRRTYTFSRRWLGAAAAALVAVTSGITYLAVRPEGPAPASSAPDAPERVATADTQRATPTPSTTTASTTDSAAEPRATAPSEAAGRQPAAPDVRPARGESSDAALASATATYDREIASLRAIVARRRGDLDSGTVAVLERNLRIIDQAIAQSRAALARDPNSQFLGEQLTRALDSKVELLRTAALLPQRGA